LGGKLIIFVFVAVAIFYGFENPSSVYIKK
jgi:hypothetical protein